MFHARSQGREHPPRRRRPRPRCPKAPHDETNPLTPRELEWLKALSQGKTVTQLAENVGYSERAMYRLLRTMYRSVHVANRTEAVLKASRAGWL